MPQKAWSDKGERQYEHIKDSHEDRGVSEDESEERAARTVNKERREEGGNEEALVPERQWSSSRSSHSTGCTASPSFAVQMNSRTVTSSVEPSSRGRTGGRRR
jgi:plasmid stabilization system protein ParE